MTHVSPATSTIPFSGPFTSGAPQPSPVRWVGGKSRLRQFIIPLIPAHERYAEPYGGGGWVLFGKRPSPVEVYNDLDADISGLMRVIRDDPEGLAATFQWELVSRERFGQLRDLDPATLTPLLRAHRTFYLIMAGWGGELGYPRFQTAVRDAGHGNRLIGALATLDQRLAAASARLRDVDIRTGSALDVISAFDQPGDVLYVDPPYPGNTVNYQTNMTSAAQHQELARALNGSRARWILSSYDTPEVRDLYGREHLYLPVSSASGMKTAGENGRILNREVLICNFEPALRTAQPGLF